MKPLLSLLVLGTAICLGQPTKQAAQEKAKSEATDGFEWLKQFEGKWATEFSGTMNSRIVAKRWVVNEISFSDGVYSVQTIGYDKKAKQFVGTWVDATSSYIWQYTGALDSTGKVLVLNSTGPDFSDPTKMRRYRDKYQFTSKSEIAVESEMLQDDDSWQSFQKGTMTLKETPKPE